MSLREHYLEKAREYATSMDREDGIPIDPDAGRAALFMALIDADKRRSEAESVIARSQMTLRKATKDLEDQGVAMESILDAICAIAPPFPGKKAA